MRTGKISFLIGCDMLHLLRNVIKNEKKELNLLHPGDIGHRLTVNVFSLGLNKEGFLLYYNIEKTCNIGICIKEKSRKYTIES
jgi:hypothetical protein